MEAFPPATGGTAGAVEQPGGAASSSRGTLHAAALQTSGARHSGDLRREFPPATGRAAEAVEEEKQPGHTASSRRGTIGASELQAPGMGQ
jgi:hypothetical protein